MEDQHSPQKPGAIDEQYLMSIMAGNTSSENAATPAPVEPEQQQHEGPAVEKAGSKARSKHKKDVHGTYGDRFLSVHSMTRRGDKSIYIRPEYHERLSRIVQVIGNDRIPLYAYLDNILQHHFELFEKAILEEFENNYKPLF